MCDCRPQQDGAERHIFIPQQHRVNNKTGAGQLAGQEAAQNADRGVL